MASRAEQDGALIQPEESMDWGCEGGKRRKSPRAEALMKEMETFAKVPERGQGWPRMGLLMSRQGVRAR